MINSTIMRPRHLLPFAAAVITMAFTSATMIAAPAAKSQGAAPAVGETFELKFTDSHGKKVDLATLKGKVVLVDFWATWCRRAWPRFRTS